MIESTLTKKPIPILYLSWWDVSGECIACYCCSLNYISDCQKWCSHCFIICTGCRYCLTTNVIFGISDKSYCSKCDRALSFIVDIENISRNSEVDNFLYHTKFNMISNYMDNIDNPDKNPLNIYNFVKNFVKIAGLLLTIVIA